MFGLFRRDPIKKLEVEYRKLLEEARDLQRSGDIQGFAAMTDRAESLAQKIDASKQGNKQSNG